jgi:hypothetical protein
VTGLEWQRQQSDLVTWAEALDLCANLVLAGKDDWRLPARIELVSIVDFTRNPSADPRAFPVTAVDYFWSSSRTALDPAQAWSIYFGHGVTEFSPVADRSAHARCVRGQAGTRAVREASGEIVRDAATKLAWQRRVSQAPVSWTAARRLCEARVPTGRWRLPTVNELQTLVDETHGAPMIDEALFPETPAEPTWTGPLPSADPSDARTVDFANGFVEKTTPDVLARVRCVCSGC